MVTKYQRPSKYAYDLLTGNVETATARNAGDTSYEIPAQER